MVEIHGDTITGEKVLRCLAEVLDPEVPVLSVVDLGIVRSIRVDDGSVTIAITPTYSGCPAIEPIKAAISDAVLGMGLSSPEILTQLSPAWTTDWIAEPAREKLRKYGIAPPLPRSAEVGIVPFSEISSHIPCPHCDSLKTEELSSFGATACKALCRCKDCREPFEYFKSF